MFVSRVGLVVTWPLFCVRVLFVKNFGMPTGNLRRVEEEFSEV